MSSTSLKCFSIYVKISWRRTGLCAESSLYSGTCFEGAQAQPPTAVLWHHASQLRASSGQLPSTSYLNVASLGQVGAHPELSVGSGMNFTPKCGAHVNDPGDSSFLWGAVLS